MRALRISLLLAGVLGFAAATARAARADEVDRWLPDSTAIYVTVENVKASSERLATHPLKALWDEPRMQKFLEGPLAELDKLMKHAAVEMGGASPADLLKALQGQVAFAVTGLR